MPEILDSSVVLGSPTATPERLSDLLATGRRAFPVTQSMFAGGPVGVAQTLEVGWHDSSVNTETGAFAVVQLGAGLDSLIGDVLRVSHGTKQVFVYVLTTADVPYPVSLYRRAWVALGRLSLLSLACDVTTVVL